MDNDSNQSSESLSLKSAQVVKVRAHINEVLRPLYKELASVDRENVKDILSLPGNIILKNKIFLSLSERRDIIFHSKDSG